MGTTLGERWEWEAAHPVEAVPSDFDLPTDPTPDVVPEKKQRRNRGPRHVTAGCTHGCISTYLAGCRCDDCRKAAADYRYKYRKRGSVAAGREYGTRRDWVLDYRLGRIS